MLNNLKKSEWPSRPLQLVTLESPEHSVLRTPAKAITFPLEPLTQQFIQDLPIFFRNLKSLLGNPAGLAAPQVGHLNAELYIDRLRPDCRYDSIENVMKMLKAEAAIEIEDVNK